MYCTVLYYCMKVGGKTSISSPIHLTSKKSVDPSPSQLPILFVPRCHLPIPTLPSQKEYCSDFQLPASTSSLPSFLPSLLPSHKSRPGLKGVVTGSQRRGDYSLTRLDFTISSSYDRSSRSILLPSLLLDFSSLLAAADSTG